MVTIKKSRNATQAQEDQVTVAGGTHHFEYSPTLCMQTKALGIE